MSDDAQVECCGNCRFFKQTSDQGGVCRENPGQVFAFPAQRVNPLTQQIEIMKNPDSGEPIFNTISFQLPKRAIEWCGRHEFRVGTSMSIDDRLTAPAEGAA